MQARIRFRDAHEPEEDPSAKTGPKRRAKSMGPSLPPRFRLEDLVTYDIEVALGGHADTALETFSKALEIDPKYAPAYLYRGQVLYEQKQDYGGAVQSWERFMALVPKGEDRERVAALVEEAKGKQRAH